MKQIVFSVLPARDCSELLHDTLPLRLKFSEIGETFFMHFFFTLLTCLVNLFFPIRDDDAQ